MKNNFVEVLTNAQLNRLKGVWRAMLHKEGTKGIMVCARWRRSFQYFLDDVGYKEKGYILSRINKLNDWKPSNVRWIKQDDPHLGGLTANTVVVGYKGKFTKISNWNLLLGLKTNRLLHHMERNQCSFIKAVEQAGKLADLDLLVEILDSSYCKKNFIGTRIYRHNQRLCTSPS